MLNPSRTQGKSTTGVDERSQSGAVHKSRHEERYEDEDAANGCWHEASAPKGVQSFGGGFGLDSLFGAGGAFGGGY